MTEKFFSKSIVPFPTIDHRTLSYNSNSGSYFTLFYWHFFMKIIYSLFLFFAIVCCKPEKQVESPGLLDCAKMTEEFRNENSTAIKGRLNRYLNQTSNHEANFEALVAELRSCSAITVLSSCYGCIYTLPAQSEIQIELAKSDESEQISLDFMPGKNGFVLVRIH